jgi:hypothetical protein
MKAETPRPLAAVISTDEAFHREACLCHESDVYDRRTSERQTALYDSALKQKTTVMKQTFCQAAYAPLLTQRTPVLY